MPGEGIRLELRPGKLLCNRRDAERQYQRYSTLHSELKLVLPKLQAVRDEYRCRDQLWGCLYAGVELAYVGCGYYAIPGLIVVLLVFALWRFNLGARLWLLIPLLILLLAADILVLRTFIPTNRRRRHLVQFTATLKRLIGPVLTEERIHRIEKPKDGVARVFTDSGVHEIDEESYDRYIKAGSPEMAYRISNLFELLSDSGYSMSPARVLPTFRGIDRVTRRLLG